MKRGVLVVGVLLLCGAIVGLAVGLLVLRPSHGDLEVTSDPPGASIFLDQKFEGVTPRTVRQLSRGTHQLRLAQAGYHDDAREITVEKRHAAIHFALRPVPTAATLVIHSDPPGANVWIDGERGPQTPARIGLLSPGALEIKVEKSGWLPHEETIELAGNGEKLISVKLVSAKVAYYLDAIEREPDNTTHYVELGRIYLSAGDLENVFQTLLKAIQAFGRRGTVLDKGFGELLTAIRKAQPDLNEKRWQQLVQGLSKTLYSREPDDKFARTVYEFFSRIEQWEGIAGLATHYLEHGKSKWLYYRWRLLARANLGRDQEVMKDLEGMLDALPELLRKNLNDLELYDALKRLQRWKELLHLCSAFIEWQPEAALPQLYRLEALRRVGDPAKFNDSCRLLVETIRRNPKYFIHYEHSLRPVLVKMERWEEMAEVCSIFYEAQPDLLEARFWYLEAMLRTGNWKSLLQTYQALAEHGFFGERKRTPWDVRYPETLRTVLFAGAWAMMELGESDRVEALLKQYESDPLKHFWVATIRGELWRRRPVGEPPKPWLEVKPCAAPPEIDGRLDDAAWAAAGRSSAFVDLHHFQKNDELASVLATWDDTHLYIGIIGHGQSREGRRPVLDVYPDRRIELFIDTDADYRTYKQFMFDGKGPLQHYDCIRGAFARANGFSKEWQPEFKLVVASEGGDHVHELAIPFRTLGGPAPRPGNIWGFNLIYLGTRSVTFAPLETTFHHPLRFGFLVYR